MNSIPSLDNVRTIGSFKIFKKGEGGMEVKFDQLSASLAGQFGDNIYHDTVRMLRKNPVPRDILDAVERVKYFFLRLTGYWVNPYNQYLDMSNFLPHKPSDQDGRGRELFETLWQNTFVTQVRIDRDGFTIMGLREVIDGKPLPLNPHRVTMDDDLDYYLEAREMIERIMRLIAGYFATAALSDIEQYRRYQLKQADKSKQAEISNYSVEELYNMYLDRMSQEGLVIMAMAPDIPEQAVIEPVEPIEMESEPEKEDRVAALAREAVQKQKEKKKQEKKKSEEPVAELMDDSSEWAPPPEKAPDPFGPPASEEGAAPEVDPEMERTANIGSGDLEYSDSDFEV